MVFWDIFKKNKKIETEKVKFQELKSWLTAKEKECIEQEKNYKKEIFKVQKQLIEDFKKEIPILKEADVEKKKSEEKIKLVVKENLANYTNQLEKLLASLEGLINYEDKEINIVEEINSLFTNFEKKSRPCFEKATFLIGEEMGNVEKSIKIFFRKIKFILDENKGSIEKLKAIKLCLAKINYLSEQIITQQDIITKIQEKEKRINHFLLLKKSKEKEIETIKLSPRFIQEEEKRKSRDLMKEQIEKDILFLRSEVDFKAITNFYHSFEKEMSLIKQYKENFRELFSKTQGEELLLLLDEAKLESRNLKKQILKINEKQKIIQSFVIEDLGVQEIFEEIKGIESEIERIAAEKLTEEKRLKKLLENIEKQKEEIKNEMMQINVEVV